MLSGMPVFARSWALRMTMSGTAHHMHSGDRFRASLVWGPHREDTGTRER
jgi:hypothetical protein